VEEREEGRVKKGGKRLTYWLSRLTDKNGRLGNRPNAREGGGRERI